MNSEQRVSRVRLADFDSSLNLHRGAGRITQAVWYGIKMLFFLSAFPYPSSFKVWLLRLFGAEAGSGIIIKPRVNIHFPWKLKIKDNVWIGEEVFILNFEPVSIGRDVSISQRAFLCCGNHDYRTPSMPYRNAPITLEDGCWVGASCFVGPGVTIATDSVLTAGSIATTSLPANGVYSGNPALLRTVRWEIAGSEVVSENE